VLERCDALPYSPEGITARWLSDALSAEHPGTRITEVETSDVIWGTSTKVFVRPTYAEGGPGNLPASFCVKGGLDRRLYGVNDPFIHILEANFYGNLSSQVPGVLPVGYYAAINSDETHGVVILEDMRGRASFFDPGDFMSVDNACSGLETLAGLHASTWDYQAGSRRFVKVGGPSRTYAKMFFNDEYWAKHFSQPGAPVMPAELDDPNRIMRAFQAMWAEDDAGRLCLVHGDTHIGNTYLDSAGELGFLDWQSYFLGPWSFDVAYFICGALTIGDRVDNERALLLEYLSALASAGGPKLTYDEAMESYAKSLLHGISWVLVPAAMQPLERVVAMSERYTAALVDHGTLSRFGV
jgi:hypothetical protein